MSVDLSEPSPETLAEVLDPYCKHKQDDSRPRADVMFIAIPSGGRGDEELRLIEYAHARGLYVIIFSKGAFAYHYARLKPNRGKIGANAIAGGRLLVLPWMRMHCVKGRQMTLHGIVNASSNEFFSKCSSGSSIGEAFRAVKGAGLAEPGATDPVSFINGEVRDTVLKTCAIYNDAIALDDGPFVTPHNLGKPVEITPPSLREVTSASQNLRLVTRVTNMLGQEPLCAPGSPGSLCEVFNGYEFSIGFMDVSRSTAISDWARTNGGSKNSIRLELDGEEGALTISGLGAGPGPTIGAAMCDLEEYMRHEAYQKRRIEGRARTSAAIPQGALAGDE